MKNIRGAGGGGGSSRSSSKSPKPPKIKKDNLESSQFATVLDLISEGEIEGLVDGHKSIFLDNTPLQNPDGSYNFQDVQIYTRNGTQTQDPIPLFRQTESEFPVNVLVENDLPITRTITNTNVDAVRVTVTVPLLARIEDDGDQRGAKVKLRIEVAYDGGGFSTATGDTISGRSTNPYQRDYIVDLSNFSTSAQIRVVRLSEPAADTQDDEGYQQYANDFNWTSYTEITYAKVKYCNSALIGACIEASQFRSIPTRKYRIRGIKVQIPSNGTVESDGRITYSGVWNGTFAAAQWTSDPAWILWDLLTNTRYGFGDHIQASQLDKFAFYSASQYASELVSDGLGGQEPRFSCNVNIQTEETAYKLINDMCSTFRVMPFWNNGALTISQDKPTDAAYAFTLANVTPEGFTYSGGSRKNRPTVAVVSYLDLNTRDIAYEVVEDQEAIEKWGVVRADVSAFACTSRNQANRIGRWLLYSERYESETVSFQTSVDAGVVVRPGQVIKISDPLRAGERRGGRIVSATTTTVTVDDATDLTTANGPQLNVVMPDGTLEQRAVSGISGSVVTVSSAFSSAPNANSIWVFGTSNIATSTWRVLTVKEEEGVKYSVTALAYNASKYDHVEQGAALIPRDITDLNVIYNAPRNLDATEVLYEINGAAKSKLLISWAPVVGAIQYRIDWREQDGNWITSVQPSPDYEIFDTKAGIVYEILVYSLNAAQFPSNTPAELVYTAVGKTEPPEDIAGLSIVPNSDSTAIVSWNRAVALDVLLGGKVLIRHSTALTGATWANSSSIVPPLPGSETERQVPLLEGTYLLKFEDDTGNQSENAATAVVDLPETQPRLLVTSIRQDQAVYTLVDDFLGGWDSQPFIDTVADGVFFGNSLNMEYDSGLDGIILTDPSLGSGEYLFYRAVDLGAVFSVNLRRHLVTRGYLPDSLWDDRTNLIDTWADIDDGVVDKVDAKLYVRSTPDDPDGSPTWSSWQELSNVLLRGRGFQFKVVATSEEASQNIIVDEVGAFFEMQQRTESEGPITALSGQSTTVNFESNFYQPPEVGITAVNQTSDTEIQVFNVTRSGFEIEFQKGDDILSSTFNYIAVGYGKETT